MRWLMSFLVSLALVLGLGLSQAPRPCLDGVHEACAGDVCRCDASCTCHLGHAAEAAAEALARASLCQHGPADPTLAGKLAALAQRCQHGSDGPHFMIPESGWTAALAAPPVRLAPTMARVLASRLARQQACRPLAPPQRPPTRSLA